MDERRRSAAPVVAAVLIALAVPILYVLSVGPASWLIEHQYLSRDQAVIFYYPVIYVVENNDSIKRVMVWYVEWLV